MKKTNQYSYSSLTNSKQESCEQSVRKKNCSSEDSTSTYSESWMLIDSTIFFWISCQKKWKWLWKKKTEQFLKRLLTGSFQNEIKLIAQNDLTVKSSCQELYSLKTNQMTQEKKRIRSVWKYHFKQITICEETDVVFTRCRMCKELFPSTFEFFVKDTKKDAKRSIQPICRKCACQLQREYNQTYRNNKKEAEQQQSTVVEKKVENPIQTTLFDEDESVESKLDKIMKYLWIKK